MDYLEPGARGVAVRSGEDYIAEEMSRSPWAWRSAASLSSSAAAALLGVALLGACAHPGAPPSPERRVERRLLVLEEDFAEFTSRQLDRAPDQEPLTPSESFAEIEVQVARLEALRLRYLDLLAQGADDRQRVVAMVRIAELHLDLGARVRRLPYPPDATAAARRGFDERLSRVALPLEAVGYGVLYQVLEYADRQRFEGRFVRLAQLYVSLHQGAGQPLAEGDVRALRAELEREGPFRAPRRLLEAGRVGQRASRR
jgi:hypothetical protein